MQQRKWLKEINQCKNNICIKTAYNKRIKELKDESQKFTNNLLQAQKNSKDIFNKTNSTFEATKILETANINAIIDTKPDVLSNQQYADLLYDYAFYLTFKIETPLYETDRKFWNFFLDNYFYEPSKTDISFPQNSNRLKIAIKVLEQAKQVTPKNASIYKLMGGIYYKLFIVTSRAYEPIRDEIPQFIKKYYTEYIKLCKEQNIKPQLNETEKNIVNKNGIFVEIFSAYNQADWLFWPYSLDSEEEMSKSEYYAIYHKIKNVCGDYIAMLNRMPDNNLTTCSRYANEENSLFEFVKYEDAPDEYKKFTTPNKDSTRDQFLLQYNNEYFVDIYFDTLMLSETYKNSQNYTLEKRCKYVYIDFNLKQQDNIYGGNCKNIKNYDQIYKNGKE
ncbi:MAG: hypothetical protein LBB59_05455 [Campylobacteraceae bacterium]|jgi:hypothetical protein|nr:hypothetical protein [Campylobacteraceae bacterium]